MLSHYENGDYYPNFDSLMQILKKLNVSISYLTGESNTQVNEIAKINIAEYTGLSEEAIDNLHLTKFLNEYYGKSMSSATDVEESREGKRPYYYYISALLSETSPHGFESFENDLEYYCKASRQLRETELLYNKSIERKDKMEEQYNMFDRKTNGLLREYRSVFELINDKIQNLDDEYFYLSEDFSVNYGDLSIEEIIEKQSELEEKIIKILHMPKVKEFVEEYIKVQNECMHYFSLTETLKNRKARAFMNIIETLDNLSKQ